MIFLPGTFSQRFMTLNQQNIISQSNVSATLESAGIRASNSLRS